MSDNVYITFYRDWWETYKACPTEYKAAFMEAIMRYGFENEMPTDPIIIALITQAINSINRSKDNYTAMCARNKANRNKASQKRNDVTSGDEPSQVVTSGDESGGNKKNKEEEEEKRIKNEEEKINIPSPSRAREEEEIKRNFSRPNPRELDTKTYGTFNNVILTDGDIHSLTMRFASEGLGEDFLQRCIDRLSAYMAQEGKTYRNHAAAILNWAKTAVLEDDRRMGSPKTATKTPASDNDERKRVWLSLTDEERNEYLSTHENKPPYDD